VNFGVVEESSYRCDGVSDIILSLCFIKQEKCGQNDFDNIAKVIGLFWDASCII
jgi:hypothetical protein